MPSIREFVNRHYQHFNAASLKEEALGYVDFMDRGGKMLVSMSGAMSTAELGISLAEMIRQDKVHAISCTGANLEEDIYNLVAHNSYEKIENWREQSAADDVDLLRRNLCRVTDTAIPEGAAMQVIERELLPKWKEASDNDEPKFPHEFFYSILLEGKFENDYDIDPKDSWLLAAAEKNLPLYVPGWEDCTCGNMFAAYAYKGEISPKAVKGGIEYMMHLTSWYRETT
ncbi:MAG: deoxyhypusine synthase family protein, partial [Verrucomicrobiota bacterium]